MGRSVGVQAHSAYADDRLETGRTLWPSVQALRPRIGPSEALGRFRTDPKNANSQGARLRPALAQITPILREALPLGSAAAQRDEFVFAKGPRSRSNWLSSPASALQAVYSIPTASVG